MSTLNILHALRTKDYTTASKQVAKMLEQKMSARLAEEKKSVGRTLVKEAGNIFPAGWDTGWAFPYSIGGGGSERPFLKDGKWNIRVFNKQTGKHETYSYSDDIFYTDAEFYGEGVVRERFAQDVNFSRDEKVVLAHCTVFGAYKALKSDGQRTSVPIGSTGNYVRKKDADWSVVWFPDYYESAEVKTVDLAHTDRGRLWEDDKDKVDKKTPAGKALAALNKSKPLWEDEPRKLAHGVEDREEDDPNKLYPVKRNGKTVWVTVPPSNNEAFGATEVCKSCKHPLKEHSEDGCEHSGCKCGLAFSGAGSEPLDEEAISQYEVQRIYDEVGDIGETEMLCGVRGLRVTPQGQVISYICEDKKSGLPDGVNACGPKCAQGDDVDPDYYCGEGVPWVKHKGYYTEAATRYTEAQLTKVWNYASSRKNDDKREYALQCLDQLKASGKAEFDDVDIPKGLGYMGAQDIRTSIRKELSENVADNSIGLEASSLGFGPGQWPGFLTYKGCKYRRDTSERDLQGEVLSFTYVRDYTNAYNFDGPPRKLIVYND